jgi:O-methyltransferase domain/Dimerisation domain
MDGFLTTQLLYVAAKLGIADVLAGGPRTGAEVAEAVGADPDLLTRVLRRLAPKDVLAEVGEGRFALTELGERLRGDVPGSIRGPVLVPGELYYQAAAGMLAAVRHGGTAFEHVYGDGSSTDLHAVLVDQPAMVEQARRRLEADGVADRCELVAGDFFASVPAGAGAYLLSRVLHDWTDARRLLATCRTAMPPGSRVLVVEALLPERAQDQPAVIRMDLHMLVLLGARERTEAQYRALLTDTGFSVERVVPTASPAGLSVVEATPASAD